MEPTDGATASIRHRSPTPADARAMWRAARDSGELDLNSPYAYLLVADHFAATSVVAERPGGGLGGFVAAYIPPTEPTAVFVWQVAVDTELRGRGVGRALLHEVVARGVAHGATHLTATVTPSNAASRSLFRAVAADLDAAFTDAPLYDAALFPGGAHEPEHRIAIGPLRPAPGP